jgi:K+-transporting ATPase ATPase B chain
MLTALKSAFTKLDRAQAGRQPGDPRHRDRRRWLATVSAVRGHRAGGQAAASRSRSPVWLWAHRPLRQLRRSDRRGPRQGRRPTALRATRVTTKAKLIIDAERMRSIPTPAHELAPATSVLVEAGDVIPADGEIIEGVASVNEGGHHRRIRAGDPRERRRPLGRHRRHHRRLGLDQGAHHLASRARPSSTA